MPDEQIHFITGKLAESALRDTISPLASRLGFRYSIQVMPITVAALMTVDWIARRIEVPDGTDRIILPGYCLGDLATLAEGVSVPVQLGPKDLRHLPQFLGTQASPPDLDDYEIEIIAEINEVPTRSIDEVVALAKSYSLAGANVIDVGCLPGGGCNRIGDYVRAIVDAGLRVSIDSMDVEEILLATAAGAELVLSVNASNRHAAADWGCEVVVVPDDIARIESMDDTIELLAGQNIRLRVDPILEPIGLGFAASLQRYFQSRIRWPDAEMMMGIGNLTELTDVDSAGVNMLLLGICAELRINSVLTTQVISWARTSIAECDIARRIVHYAVTKQIPPKNLSAELVSLRDARPTEYSDEQLAELTVNIRDNNYRILTAGGLIHLLGSQQRFSDSDPFAIFAALAATHPKNLDAAHAFYLGYEMSKAVTAITLGKNYVQDESLDWGHLTIPEAYRKRKSRGD